MKTLILAAFMLAAQQAQAKPYFRFEALDNLKTSAVFCPAGNADAVAWGTETAVFRHHAEDGYFLIPGVSWDVLDVGASKGERWSALIGSSVDLSEPVKAMALRGLDWLAPEKFGALRLFLEPAPLGAKSFTLNLGPGLSLDPGDGKHLRDIRGAFVFHVGGVVRFK